MSRGNCFFPLYRKETIPFEGIVGKSAAALWRLSLLPSRSSALDQTLLAPLGGDGWWDCEPRSASKGWAGLR